MEAFYKKSKGNAGLDGVQFQVNLLTVFMLNALRNFKDWRISTENEAAGKFDDVVIEFSDRSTVLLQAKHKDNKRINRDQLLSDNSKSADFSLPKYFLSYQEIKPKFPVRNIIICTNADVDKKKLEDILAVQNADADSILHYEGENCSFVIFNESISTELKANSEKYCKKNLEGKGMYKELISQENIKDFLGKLQFFTDYPSGNSLHKIIDQLLSRLTDSKLWKGTTSQEINIKVEEWFKFGRGEYLTEALANAMFCEIKSDKYCKTLKDYNVVFVRNNLNFTAGKRIFHVSHPDGEYLVRVLKIYYALQGKKTLYLDFEDDIEKQMVEAFRIPKYVFLVLICEKVRCHNKISGITDKLKEILNAYKFKKVVLVGGKQLAQQLVLEQDILDVDGPVTFDDFTQQTKEELVRKRNITFQGEEVSLEELLKVTLPEEFTKAVNANILEKLVADQKIAVGIRSQGLDEDIVRYYINRAIERDTYQIGDDVISYAKKKEVVTEGNIIDVKEKVVLISDSAGMGKSTVLAKLAVDMKEKYPNLWIVIVELNNYTRILRDTLRKRKRTIKVTDLLNSNDETKLTNHLENHVFAMDKKVVLLLDGIDEVSPDYTQLILGVLRQCREDGNFAKIVITTRPHMNGELEETLQVRPFMLRPFTTVNQVDFLTSYWVHNLELDEEIKGRCEKYAMTLIRKISSWMKQENSFTAVPLHVRMMAEIFEENISQATSWEGCKEFLDSNESEPTLPERMKLTELYDMFIEKKLEIFIDKLNPTGIAMGHSFKTLFDQYFVCHQSLAIEIILDSSSILRKKIVDLFPQHQYRYDNNMEIALLKIGIVQKVNGKMNFVHRTFGEYFVAKSILELSDLNQHTFNQDAEFQKFFIDEALCTPEFTVIRAFLESVLEDVADSLPCDTFKNYQNFTSSDPQSWSLRSELIHLAAREGSIAILRLILKCINFKVITGKEVHTSELEGIVKSDACDTLTLLNWLSERGGINIKARSGDTPLHFAAGHSSLEMIKFLVEQGADVNTKNNNKATPLHLATQKGHLESVKFLVESGTDDLDTKDYKGITAMILAAFEGHLDIVKYLVGRGADVNTADKDDFTPLHAAATQGHLDIVKFLIQSGVNVNALNKNGATAIHSSAPNGHLDTVMYLVECGVNLNAKDFNDCGALFAAVYGGYLDAVRFLVSTGIDLNARKNDGSTVLHLAALKGYLDIAEFLLDSGIDINIGDTKGFTALHEAANEGYLGIVQLFVERGMDVDIEDNCKSTPLLLAAMKGHLEVVDYLLAHGANVNLRNNNSFSVLHVAAQGGHLDIVKRLVESGADVSVLDKNGFDPLFVATCGGHLNTVRYLAGRNKNFIQSNDDGFTLLYVAARAGHLSIVKFLVECNMNINARNKDGLMALHTAIRQGHLEVVKYLVENGGDANARTHGGFTPLHLSAGFGHLDIVRFLVGFSDLNAKSDVGITPLKLAAEKVHKDIVEFLLGQGASLDIEDNQGFTVLHAAALQGHLDIVKYLVLHGADINASSKFGTTPLCSAVLRGHVEVVEYLVLYDVDCDKSSSSYKTALHKAAENNNPKIVELLVRLGVDINTKNEDGVTALHLAAQEGHLETVQLIVSEGADVNVKTNNDCTPLLLAALEGNLEVSRYLLQNGADVNSAEKCNYTPLHLAAENNHLQVVQFLKEHGADMNFKTTSGNTPLHFSSSQGNLAVVDYFVSKGVDVNIKDNRGTSALHFAVQNGHLDTVKYLVESGVDANSVEDDGFTALHIAAQYGRLDMVKFLLAHQVDVHATSKGGFTVLHSAAKMDRIDVAKVFLECGLDVNLQSAEGSTPLHLAAEQGHLDAVKFLVSVGADVNIKTSGGSTASCFAAAQDHSVVVEFLKEQEIQLEEAAGWAL